MTEFTLTGRQEQKQTAALSQQQLYSLRLLAMTTTELQAFVGNELESNPVLEPDEGTPAQGAEDVEGTSDPTIGERTLEPYEGRHNLQAEVTLRDELLFQLMTGTLELPTELGEYIIACLDSNGYLKTTAEAIGEALGLPTAQVESAIGELQRLEPTGVFARSLSECLLLQLRALPSPNPVAERIARDYLEAAAQNRLHQIAKEIGVTLEETKAAFGLIKTLNPRPGSGFSSGHTAYVTPDIKVSLIGGEPHVSVLAGLGVHLNSYYLDRLPLVDNLTRDYLQEEIRRGRFLIRCMEQRRKTLRLVATGAVDHHRQFFTQGAPLAPLTMAELAAILGLHESTVSRAVSGKYLRYPGGTMPLAGLFCGKLAGGASAGQAKESLAALVAQEDKAHPYSDQRLAELLAKQGILLSRRGVAKYRDELGILPSQGRKEQ